MTTAAGLSTRQAARRQRLLDAALELLETRDYERIAVDRRRTYRANAVRHYLSFCPPGDFVVRPPTLAGALREKKSIIVDATAEPGRLRAHIDLLERLAAPAQRGRVVYVPILFAPAKATRADKLLLAFQGIVLAAVQGAEPASGKVIHGSQLTPSRAHIGPLMGDARGVVREIEEVRDKGAVPQLVLNQHCGECEFRKRCREAATATCCRWPTCRARGPAT